MRRQPYQSVEEVGVKLCPIRKPICNKVWTSQENGCSRKLKRKRKTKQEERPISRFIYSGRSWVSAPGYSTSKPETSSSLHCSSLYRRCCSEYYAHRNPGAGSCWSAPVSL